MELTDKICLQYNTVQVINMYPLYYFFWLRLLEMQVFGGCGPGEIKSKNL